MEDKLFVWREHYSTWQQSNECEERPNYDRSLLFVGCGSRLLRNEVIFDPIIVIVAHALPVMCKEWQRVLLARRESLHRTHIVHFIITCSSLKSTFPCILMMLKKHFRLPFVLPIGSRKRVEKKTKLTQTNVCTYSAGVYFVSVSIFFLGNERVKWQANENSWCWFSLSHIFARAQHTKHHHQRRPVSTAFMLSAVTHMNKNNENIEIGVDEMMRCCVHCYIPFCCCWRACRITRVTLWRLPVVAVAVDGCVPC